jgi:hypothetical protein
MSLLVCHIGWMAAYEGLVGQPDKIVGGGAWVRKHKDGGETCNFVKCDDGNVYGHVVLPIATSTIPAMPIAL